MFTRALAIFALSLGGLSVVSASGSAWLYQAAVALPDQSAASRDRGLSEALATVLVRLTGDRYVASRAETLPLLSSAAQYAQSFGFDSNPTGGLRLTASFDARALDRALRAQGLPLWSAQRPAHLVWLAVSGDGQGRAVLDGAGLRARGAALLAIADARGLPLVLPQGDAADRNALGYSEVCNDQHGVVRAASARYAAARTLAACATREASGWYGRFSVLSGSAAQENWSAAANSLDELLADAAHQLADRQAAQLAVRAGGFVQELVLEVAGVQALSDYARALNYLRGLPPVRTVAVERVANQTVSFRLRLEGDPGALARLLAAGTVLQAAAGTESYVLVR